MSRSEPIQSSRPPDGAGAPLRVVGDASCVACGYNLRGLRADANCPECGHAIADSLRTSAGPWADQRWTRRVQFGLLILAGQAAAAVAFRGSIGAWLGWVGLEWYPLILAAYVWTISAWWLIGAFLVTAPPWTEPHRTDAQWLRRAARWLGVFALVVLLANTILLQPWRLPVFGRQGTVFEFALQSTGLIAWLVAKISLWMVLLWLCRRSGRLAWASLCAIAAALTGLSHLLFIAWTLVSQLARHSGASAPTFIPLLVRQMLFAAADVVEVVMNFASLLLLIGLLLATRRWAAVETALR